MKNDQETLRITAPSGKRVALSLLMVAAALLSSIFDAAAAELCTPAIALAVSVQGMVEVRRSREKSWQKVLLNDPLCPGDTVRIRDRGRAAVRFNNETVLRLDQKTDLTLESEDKDKTTLLEMMSGAIHVLTRTPRPFKIKTPFLNAGVDGTEFFIGLDQDQARLVMYEGKVSASNEHGSVNLVDNEAVVASRDRAPQKELIVRPLDAVQWALYYPIIINSPLGQEAAAGHPITETLRASVELYQYGNMSEALAMLDDIPESNYSSRVFTFRAGLLLSVGRIDEGRADIEQALKLESGNSDALALQAIIAVVQNDKEQALILASRAVELSSTSSTARLSLSYAQQAHFRIKAALDSVRKAVEIDPQNALAWARLAELYMSTGYLNLALEAAQQAVELNPRLAKTQTVLGFTYLVQMETGTAKAVFSRAIELDQADPMPRLGMGLAKIREGDLEAGRIELEIAASLDPGNSLIRSYLGKAYFEEKRYSLAGTQFDLARDRDPNDPTPWLYDGIMKQTQNQPVEALRDIQRSIELNDNRAVYRSRLLLDQDEAARGSSLARIYDNLGFEKRARMETAKSLSIDPANHSAHRFLSDAYLNTPWHEIARASELLQAQLFQPINVNPVQPHLAVADLNIITSTGPSVAGFNEFTPLLERNKPQLVASGVVGSNSTIGNETVLSGLYGPASVSVGQFHYNTDGFRANNDQKHNIYNAFIQYAVTQRFNVQAEMRTRQTENGDLLLRFDRRFDPEDRRELKQDIARFGARFSLSPTQDLIASAIYTDRRTDSTIVHPGLETINNLTKDKGYQIEAQYLFRDSHFNLAAGLGTYQFEVDKQGKTDFSPRGGESCPEFINGRPLNPSVCNRSGPTFPKERNTGYFYANLNHIKNISGTLGLSYDSFQDGIGFEVNKFNPKLGLQLNFSNDVRLRLAWFETVKSFLATNQTLEPTQVAGFNQLFDDVNGTRARRKGIGLDARVASSIYGGIEISARDLEVPFYTNLDKPAPGSPEKQHERVYQGYLYWLPHPYWAIRAEPRLERFFRAEDSFDASRIKTFSAPLSFNYFDPSGITAKLTATYVNQRLTKLENSTELSESEYMNKTTASNFVLLDAVLGYRFPKRRGIISLEGRNLLNENFNFRSYNLQFNEIFTPRFIPGRTFFVRLTLNF